jgi:hypothetical protein
MTYGTQVALIISAIVVGVLLLLYLGLGVLFFFIALGNKKRPDPTVPCKDSLFERNADNVNLIAGYKWYDENYIRWREILEDFYRGDISEDGFVIEALNLITGGEWDIKCIRGCCQSDWNYCYFDSKKWTDDALNALEVEYFNTGTEWIIHDGDEDPETPEDIDGYCVYCTEWSNDGIRRQLAEAHGGNAEDVILYEFDGYSRIASYKEATE